MFNAVRFVSLAVGLALSLACCAGSRQAVVADDTTAPGLDPAAPACLVEIVEQPPRPEPLIPAPDVSPAEGTTGTTVTVTGTGMPADNGVMVIAFYGSQDCGLPKGGRGDHLLAFTTASEDGSYHTEVAWPGVFDPVEGRGLPEEGVELPAGRYFIIAVPCPSLDRACFEDFSLGSAIGGPFTSLEP